MIDANLTFYLIHMPDDFLCAYVAYIAHLNPVIFDIFSVTKT